MSITQAALDQATKQASSTGVPQPVRDDSGHIVYYVDGSGAVVPEAVARDAATRAAQAQASKLPSGLTQDVHGNRRLTTIAQAAADKKKADDAAAAAIQAAQNKLGYVWVDGHRMRVTQVDGAGNPTLVSYDGLTNKPTAPPVQTAYAALDSSGVPDSGTQFVFSNGIKVDPNTGVEAMHEVGGRAANPLGQNRMTISNAVQWLAGLSTTDKGAYLAMVERLHDAKYLSDAQLVAAQGGWNSDVGLAYAYAARDTAVVNSTPNGANTTLTDLLAEKARAGKAADAKTAEASYTPVERSFTDPTAIAGQAKTAAEQAIGRDLTPEETARLTAHFHSLEAAKFDTIDSVGRANAAHPNDPQASVTVTDPNVGGQIDNFLSTGPLAQEGANYYAGQMGLAIKNLLSQKA